MSAENAIAEAKYHWPRIAFDMACPVLPNAECSIESAMWLVLAGQEYVAFVDGGPGPQLYKRI